MPTDRRDEETRKPRRHDQDHGAGDDLSAELLLDAIYEFDTEGRLTYANQSARDLFGLSPSDDLSVLRLEETIVPEDREISRKDVRRILAGATVRGERTFVRRDGERFLGEVHSGPVIRDGQVIGVRGVLRDITARRLAEEQLRESEQRFKALFDLSPHPVAVTELTTGRLLEVNRQFTELSGYEKEEVLGELTWEIGILSQEDRQRFAAQLRRDGEVRGLPMRFYDRHGATFDTRIFARVISVAGRQLIMTVVHDVTDQRRLEDQLLQAQKMEAIGTLAGGVAHDFNNMLTVVGGLVSLGRTKVDPDGPVAELLNRIDEQVRSAGALTRQLLGYARADTYELVVADLSQIARCAAEVFERTHRNIELQIDCPPEPCPVEVDRSQIEHALLNLFVNAAHAMPEGGRLDVATRNMVLDDASAGVHQLAAGRYTAVTVADSGTGMDEHTRKRVFEPFFTTKGLGRGTGLGLASVYGIITSHEGAIEVQSKPGAGTRFDVLLPATEAAIPVGQTDRCPPLEGHGLVLLVDDEQAVADVGRAMLQELGYQVLVARTGRAAIELFRERFQTIDVVILDMVMPGMAGAAVLEQLLAIRQDAAVLLVSGYSHAGDAAGALAQGGRGFLRKPFEIHALGQRVAAILADVRGGTSVGRPG